MGNYLKQWIKYAGIRAIKTIAQTALATMGTSAVISNIDWVLVGSSSLLAGLHFAYLGRGGWPRRTNKHKPR